MHTIPLVLLLALSQHPAMPPGMTHEEHLAQTKKDAELQKRGEAAMGFDQTAAEHHFLIRDDGGVIEVTAKDRGDSKTRDAIRSHLQTIAAEFAEGVFVRPTATHGEVPPGVGELQRLRGAIRYRYEAVEKGGRVRIVATEPAARAAIREFLRYQIREHRTGDPE